MASKRRGNLHSRLASLEYMAGQQRDERPPRVVVYLPRKDGDTQPTGVCSQTKSVLTILYDRDLPNPLLPDGW